MGVQWIEHRLLFWYFWMRGVALCLCASRCEWHLWLRARYLPQAG